MERNGEDRRPRHEADWSRVLQVLSAARPDQEGYPEHDGAVRIDRKDYVHLANKWN